MNIFFKIIARLRYYRCIMRSYIFCFKYLPYHQAKKMPFFLNERIKILELKKGDIIINGEIRSHMIWIGGGVELGQERGLTLEINERGKLIFEGSAFFANGCYFRIHPNATMLIGDKFGANSCCFVRSVTKVSFGKDVLLGWNNEIIDSDGHEVWVNGELIEKEKPIYIGDHVWITSHVRINKGVYIANDCIIAKGAVVVKQHIIPHTLIGGVPAKNIMTGVDWKK